MTQPYQSIRCDLLDYVEAMCIQRLEVEIKTDHETIQGIGITTKTDSNKCEWLLHKTQTGESEELRLDKILSIHPVDNDAPISEIYFK